MSDEEGDMLLQGAAGSEMDELIAFEEKTDRYGGDRHHFESSYPQRYKAWLGAASANLQGDVRRQAWMRGLWEEELALRATKGDLLVYPDRSSQGRLILSNRDDLSDHDREVFDALMIAAIDEMAIAGAGLS